MDFIKTWFGKPRIVEAETDLQEPNELFQIFIQNQYSYLGMTVLHIKSDTLGTTEIKALEKPNLRKVKDIVVYSTILQINPQSTIKLFCVDFVGFNHAMIRTRVGTTSVGSSTQHMIDVFSNTPIKL